MNPKAMEPFGMALRAHFEGSPNVKLIVRRDDGKEATLPASVFFREPAEFTDIEKTAIELSEGRVLDIGAGAGSLSLALRAMGHPVTAVDVSSHAAAILRERGVEHVYCADILEFQGGPFDTLLMMGHGIGMVESVEGLDRFLRKAHELLALNGQLLLDSLDVRVSEDPDNMAYLEANRRAHRYIGEIRMQFEFQGQRGPFCGWLHVDGDTLTEQARWTGWQCQIVRREQTGDYLARLIKGAG